MPPSVIIYSLGPGAVHIPPIRPTKIAKMKTIPTGSAGIKPGDVYWVAPVTSTKFCKLPFSSSPDSERDKAQLLSNEAIKE